MPSRSHKASAHSARWHLVIKSFCSWARWPYCCCMLSSLFSDASIVVLWRAKGDVVSFPFSKVLVLLDPSQLIALYMEPISGGAYRFVFEDQPPDAFEFQFYKVVQFPFFLSSWLYPPSPSIINNSSSSIINNSSSYFHWSTPWIDVKALT